MRPLPLLVAAASLVLAGCAVAADAAPADPVDRVALAPVATGPSTVAVRTPLTAPPRSTPPVRASRTAVRPPRAPAIGTSDPVRRGGPRVTWSIDVEAGTGLDLEAVAAEVAAALHDPRSWAGPYELVRVAPGEARIDVLVASPATVDRLCARAGLDTNGIFSCWNGATAALNLWRWTDGDDEFDDLAVYRAYLVNHEVGHGLGRGHADCPGPGQLAPLMQQQTRTLAGCRPNPWANP